MTKGLENMPCKERKTEGQFSSSCILSAKMAEALFAISHMKNRRGNGIIKWVGLKGTLKII